MVSDLRVACALLKQEPDDNAHGSVCSSSARARISIGASHDVPTFAHTSWAASGVPQGEVQGVAAGEV